MSQQVSYSQLRRATMAALNTLSTKALIVAKAGPGAPVTPTPGSAPALPALHGKPVTGRGAPDQGQSQSQGQGQPRYWEATQMGAAVYQSALPTVQGIELYKRCVCVKASREAPAKVATGMHTVGTWL